MSNSDNTSRSNSNCDKHAERARLPRSFQVASDDCCQDLVARRVEVQPVLHEQVFARLAVRAERGGAGVDVVQVLLRRDVLLDQLIRLRFPRNVRPARGRGIDRHVGDPHAGQFAADLLDKRLEVRRHLFGRLAGLDVVAAGGASQQDAAGREPRSG